MGTANGLPPLSQSTAVHMLRLLRARTHNQRATLLQALGLQEHAPVPPSRGRGWQVVCAAVHRLLREEGCAVRLRSPTAIAEAFGTAILGSTFWKGHCQGSR